MTGLLWAAAGMVALLGAARGMGTLAERMRLPSLVGELLAGVLLGATVLGSMAPGWYASMFPATGAGASVLQGLAEISLAAFLFLAGMEVNLGTLRTRRAAVAWVSALGILAPFALSVAAVHQWPSLWPVPPGRDGLLLQAMVLGTILSISSLPVISRILMSLRLLGSSAGTLILAAATVNDLVGWLALSALLSLQGLGAAAGWGSLAAFLAGLAAGRMGWAGKLAPAWLREAVNHWLAPIYFASIGLPMNFVSHFNLPVAASLMGVACAGKLSGGYCGARLGGRPWPEALLIAFGMNARGAMAIVLSTVAWRHGLVTEDLFVALVMVALATSLLSAPAIRLLRGRLDRQAAPATPAAAEMIV